MAAGEYDTCKGEHASSKRFSGELIPLLFVFPCHLCFALFFLFKLWWHNHIKIGFDSDTTIDVPFVTVVFILFSLFASFLAFGNEIIEPMRQTEYAPIMELCQTTRFLSWFFGGLVYGAQLEVFIFRLQLVFERWNSLRVSRWIVYSFNAVFFASAVFGGTLFGMRASVMTCWTPQKYGFLSDTPLFPKQALFCNTQPKKSWLRLLASLQLLVVFVVCAVSLLWMFLWRMKKVRKSTPNHRFDKIVEKATLVTYVGLISTCLALIITGFTGYITLVYVDYLVNMFLLYLMFSFGDEWYNALFAGMVRSYMKVRMSIGGAMTDSNPENRNLPSNSCGVTAKINQSKHGQEGEEEELKTDEYESNNL